MKVWYKHIDTPVGKMRVAGNDAGICVFDFAYRKALDGIWTRIERSLDAAFEEGDHPFFTSLEMQINEYFAGTRRVFDLPLNLVGTEFQKSVWNGLLDIPYGHTRSYKKQSIFLGNEKAIRAVARANGENSIAIIIPCHRVIGENGSLVGYGGGLPNKRKLLELEWKHLGMDQQGSLF